MAEQWADVIKQYQLVPWLLNVMSDPDFCAAVTVTLTSFLELHIIKLSKWGKKGGNGR